MCWKVKKIVQTNSNGRGQQVNMEELSNLEHAAVKGDVNSQRKLAYHYCSISDMITWKWGVRSAIDAKKGIGWLEQAALSGHVESQRLLGCIYLNGPTILDDFPATLLSLVKNRKKIVLRNINLGEKWLRRAGSNGDSESTYILGSKYIEGICAIEKLFCKRNIEKGKEFLVNAATESNNPYYQYELGLRYSDSRDTLRGQPAGVTCFKVDHKEAEKWFVCAANNDFLSDNLPIFKLDIAKRYYYGHGISRSYSSSREWLEKAINVNSYYTEALYMLGLIYSNGLGLSQDAVKANELFLKVEESYLKGNHLYLLRFSTLFFKYADGDGVPYDASKAQFWAEKYIELLIDAKKNHPSYRRMKSDRKSISKRFRNGEGVPVNVEIANKLEII